MRQKLYFKNESHVKQVLVYCDIKYSDFFYSPTHWQENEVEWDQINSSLDNPVQKNLNLNIFLPSACLSYIASTEIVCGEKNNVSVKIQLEARDALLESVEMECKHYHLMTVNHKSNSSLLRFSFNGKQYPLDCSLSLEGPKVLNIIALTLQKNKLLYYPEELVIYGHNDDLSLQSKGFSEHDCIPVILSGVTREREKTVQLEQKDGYLYYEVSLKNDKDLNLFVRNANSNAFFYLNRLVIRFGSIAENSVSYSIIDLFSMLHDVYLPHLEVLSLIYFSIDASENWMNCFFANSCVALKDLVVYIPCAPVLMFDAKQNNSRPVRRIIKSIDTSSLSYSSSISSSILDLHSVSHSGSKVLSNTVSDTASDTASDTLSVPLLDLQLLSSSDNISIAESIENSKAQPGRYLNTAITPKSKSSIQSAKSEQLVSSDQAEDTVSNVKELTHPLTSMTTSTVINGVSYNIVIKNDSNARQTTYTWKRMSGTRSFSVKNTDDSCIITVFVNNIRYFIPVSRKVKNQTLYSAVVRGLGMYGIRAYHSSISLLTEKGEVINKNVLVSAADTSQKYNCVIQSKKFSASNSEITLDMRKNVDQVIVNYLSATFVNKVINVLGRS